MRITTVLLAIACSAGCRTSALEHWLVGQMELEAGNVPAAIDCFEQCKRLDAEFAPAYISLAAAWCREGDSEAMRNNLSRYLELNPDHHAARLYLAECLRDLSKPDEAREQYRQFVVEERSLREKDIHRRKHAYLRLAELAEHEDRPGESAFYTAMANYESALLLLALPEASKLEETQTEASAILADVLDDFQIARESLPDKRGIDDRVCQTSKLLQEMQEGRPTTLAVLPPPPPDVADDEHALISGPTMTKRETASVR